MDVSEPDANNSDEECCNVSSLLGSSPLSPESDKEMSEEIAEGFMRLKELVTELFSEDNYKSKWEVEENGQFVKGLLKQLSNTAPDGDCGDSSSVSSDARVNEDDSRDILETEQSDCDEDVNATSESEMEVEDEMLSEISHCAMDSTPQTVTSHSNDSRSDIQDLSSSSFASFSAPSSPWPCGVSAVNAMSCVAPGKSRYEMIRDDIIAERNEQLKAMGFFAEFSAIRSEMSPKKPKKLKYKMSIVKGKSGSKWVRRSERLVLSSPEIEKSCVLIGKRKDVDVSKLIDEVLNTVCQKKKLANSESSQLLQYACKTCRKEFKKERYLAAHVKHVKCDPEMKRNVLSRKVKITKVDVKLYKCDQCDFTTKFQSLLPRHKYSVHKVPSAKKYYACDHCEYVHEWKCRVNTHRLWVHKLEEPLKPRNTYECDQCNDFDTMHFKEFMRHKSEIHSVVTRCYSCDECSFSTNNKHSLKRHTSLLHTRTSDGDSDIESIEIFTDDSEEEDH